jgi:hypothetical protein
MTTRTIAIALTFGFLAFTLSTLPVRAAAQLPAGAQCTTRGGHTVRSLGVDVKCDSLCRSDETLVKVWHSGGVSCAQVTCCKTESLVSKTAPVNPCEAQGPRYEYSAKAGGCVPKPTKDIGTSKTTGESASTDETPAVLKPIRDCKAKGWLWDPATKQCNPKPVKNIGTAKTGDDNGAPKDTSALKAACLNQGLGWDDATGHCKKRSQVKAECESRGHTYDVDTGRCVKSLKTTDESDDDYKPKNKNKKKKKYDDDDDDDNDDHH